MYQLLYGMQDGTVAVVSGENLNYSGRTPPGPLKSWSDVPGHFFFAVKNSTAADSLEFWDGQSGSQVVHLPGTWAYRAMVVGNPFQP